MYNGIYLMFNDGFTQDEETENSIEITNLIHVRDQELNRKNIAIRQNSLCPKAH